MASLEEMNNLWVSNAGRVNDCIFCGSDHEWVLFETEHYKLIRNRYQIAE